MNQKIEVCNEQEHINKDAIQEWISVNDYLPLNSWKIGGEMRLKGDYLGRFLCVVERPSIKDSLSYKELSIYHSVELCYWNDLAMKFQDMDNEWVVVTHWTQIPTLPQHKSILISRTEMLDKIEKGVFDKIYHKKETDEYYQSSRDCALSQVSYNEKLWYSSTRNKEHIEDYMYCILSVREKRKEKDEYGKPKYKEQ